jgi:hypothetical protein
MPFLTQLIRRSLYVQVVTLAALSILFPVKGTTAPQVDDPREHPPKLLNYSKMTTQQLFDEGEKIIFGGLRLAKVEGAVGRGQCTLCHATLEGMQTERAPNLFGATKRAAERLKDPRYYLGKPLERDTVQKEAFPGAGTATTPLEYIAETFMCPSCYVVVGYGVRGTDDKESPDIKIIAPPVSLKIDDLVAVTTWLYLHDNQVPPPPAKIVKAFRKFMTPKDWKAVTTIPPPAPKLPLKAKIYSPLLAYGDEPIEEIFGKAQCGMCHTIPGILKATGAIGPSLAMKSVASLRLADPAYEGNATSIREYLIESILFPSLYVPSGYPDDTHPKVYGEQLSAKALYRIVEYLSQMEEDPSLIK